MTLLLFQTLFAFIAHTAYPYWVPKLRFFDNL